MIGFFLPISRQRFFFERFSLYGRCFGCFVSAFLLIGGSVSVSIVLFFLVRIDRIWYRI